MKKVQKTFLWRNSHVKIKHQTLCNSFETEGLKNVDVNVKTTSLLCSWVQKLYDNNFHEWKIIPLHLIVKNFGNKFNFHSNLSFNKDLIDDFPLFYKNIFNFWSKHLSVSPELPSLILSNYLWYNNDILINKKPVYFPYFSEKNINHIAHLFDNFGKVKDWNVLKEEFYLDNKFYFQWMQLINAIPSKWKKIIKDEGKCENLLLLNHHLIKHNNLVRLEKLTSKELYSMQILNFNCKPTSQYYFEMKFPDVEFDWKYIYTLSRKITTDPYSRYFQYKFLNNVLYLNDKLFFFGKSETKQCSFCNEYPETVAHLFFSCNVSKNLWLQLKLFFGDDILHFDLSPQTALFGFTQTNDANIQNHLLLLFKLYLYRSRCHKNIHLKSLLFEINKVKSLEKSIAESNQKKIKFYKLKWNKVEAKLMQADVL